MQTNTLQKAKERLFSGGYTCVLCKGEEMYTSTLRGVKPLIKWYEEGKKFCGFSAADKVIGKATAFLYLLLGVREVYAFVLSRSALETLKKGGIYVEYSELTEHIINRKGDGICPFEEAVTPISDCREAYLAIWRKMAEIGIDKE